MNCQPNVMSKSFFSFLTIMDCTLEFVSIVKELFILACRIFAIILFDIVKNIVPRRMKDLRNEIVLITGSAQGIGRQLAIDVAKLGAKVVLWDINKDQLEKVTEEIISNGGQASAYVCDVTSENEVKAKAEIVSKELGDVTILVNNAGMMQNVPILVLDSEKIKRTFELNTLAHFWTIRAFLPKMRENNHGQIVAIASAAGIMAHVNQTDYSASKFAVVGMMEALGEELRLRGSNIRLTTVCPVTVNTGMNQHPIARYHWLIPILTIKEAAHQALIAIRREEYLVTIPRRVKFSIQFAKLLPMRVMSEVMDVLDYCRVSNIVPQTMEEKNHTTT